MLEKNMQQDNKKEDVKFFINNYLSKYYPQTSLTDCL